MNVFYTEHIIGKIAILTEEEAHHCARTLRKRIGDPIRLTDGKGHFYEGNISEINKKDVQINIRHIENIELAKPHIHIALAPTKNIERWEWFLEKATEIGIHEISPICTKNSERETVRIDRSMKIVLAAMKQSLKAHLPLINEIAHFNKFIKKQKNTADTQYFIAHCAETEKTLLQKAYQQQQNVCIMIGPEGDFSTEEIQNALQENFTPISLGAARLRTETAGIVAVHTIHILNTLL